MNGANGAAGALMTIVALLGCGDDTSSSSTAAAGGGGGGGGGGGAGGAEPTIEEACGESAAAQCALYAECAPFTLAINFESQQACEEHISKSCVEEAGAPGNNVKAERLLACAEGLRDLTCTSPLEGDYPPECTPTPGELSDGETCVSPVQCEGGVCNIASDWCGVCDTPAKEGDPCGAGKPDCPYSTSCVGGKCEVGGYLGDACSATEPCSVLPCVDGECVLFGEEGDPCAPDRPCQFGLGLACDPGRGVCIALSPVALGEACSPGLFCEGDGMCLDGVCVAKVEEGKACDTSGAPCVLFNNCVDGVCTRRTVDSCGE